MIRNVQQQEEQDSGEGQGTSFIVNLASGTPSESDDMSTSSLSANDELGLYDVICGRHKAAFDNIGNRRFRVTVSLTLERYINASTRKEKSAIINSIADLVRSSGGRFLQRQDGAWVELNEKHSNQKVGHALRDMAVAAATKATRTRVSTAAAAMKSVFLLTKTMARQVASKRASLQVTHATETATFATEKVITTEKVIASHVDVKSRRESVDSFVLAWLLDNSSEFMLDNAEN